MFYEHKHELVFALNGRNVSEMVPVIRYTLWAMFADKAKIFGQRVVQQQQQLVIEVRTDYPDDVRMSIAAAAARAALTIGEQNDSAR